MDKEKGPGKMKLRFQVAQVHKPLLSVRRVTEAGNLVSFGPGAKDNFIQNKNTGEKIALRPNDQGSFLLDVVVPGSGPAEVTVDSGAEESVCPVHFASQFGLDQSGPKLAFRGADGKSIPHMGTREVLVDRPF